MSQPPDSTSSVEALRISAARWRAVIDAAVDGIIVIDSRGRIETVNHAAEQMFGYTEAELIGQNVSVLMPEPDRSRHDGYINHFLETGERKIIGIGRSVTAVRRDGQQFPVHLSVGAMEIDGEKHFTGILHDLSRRTELEERLREATALARLGEMAAVIAHEVKNPLAAVRGAVQVIGSHLPAGRHRRRDRQGDHRAHRRAERSDPGSAGVRAPAEAAAGAHGLARTAQFGDRVVEARSGARRSGHRHRRRRAAHQLAMRRC